LTVGEIHYYLHDSTQLNAQFVVSEIEKYSKQSGHCPPDLASIGMSTDQLKNNLGNSAYFCESGKPRFFYSSTFVPYARESYDFEKRLWQHKGD
jgi:hypothetical protein